MTGTKRRQIDLDVIRGSAILLAMGWHLNHVVVAGPGDWLLAPGRTIGWAGVDLFFVLSGFLIGSLIIREVRHTGRFDYARFLGRRVLRLWPTLYVFLFAMLAARVAPWQSFFWQIALHVQNFVPTKSATHLWSLAVEEHFYLVLGAVFPLILQRMRWRRALPLLLIATLLLCPALRLLAVATAVSPTALQTETQFRLDALAIGVLLAFVSLEAPDLFARLLRLKWLWGAVVVMGGTFLWRVPKDSVLGSSLGYTISWTVAAAVLLLTYRSGLERHARAPCLALAFIGRISYPLYLWHVPVGKIGYAFLGRHMPGFPALQVVLVYAVSIVVAWIMTIAVEHPFMRLRDHLMPARAAALPDSGGTGTVPDL